MAGKRITKVKIKAGGRQVVNMPPKIKVGATTVSKRRAAIATNDRAKRGVSVGAKAARASS
jgi:hypothetical protein